jgi:predicted RNA-binding Zn-ribbon protein involved in translation (DUF1610 family)
MQAIVADIASRYKLARRGGRWVGPCPQCGGSDRSDKFNMRDDGGFKCYACGFKGDAITWLRKMEGKSCPEAHELAGVECRATACPASGSCRFGNGTGPALPRHRAAVAPLAAEMEKRVATTTATDPQDLWQQWAENLIATASQEILRQPAVLTWLKNRGIDRAAVERFRLGWRPKNSKVDRQQIGLTPKDGKETMWVPAGLLIPIVSTSGAVHRLRVRRPSWAREKFLPDLKYIWLDGSGRAPLVITPAGCSRGTVVEEAELDAYATAAAHDQVTVIALGTVQGPLTQEIKAMLATEPVILVALDADPGKDGRPGAGPEALANWLREFRQAKFWPVPAGKDPGDYVQEHGGDLWAWVEAGLVPPPTGHDAMSSPDGYRQGGGGGGAGNHLTEGREEVEEEVLAPGAPEKEGSLAAASRIVTLADGRSFHVVQDEAAWRQLVAQGETVFSENELKRLQAACASCGPDGGPVLASAVLDVKAVFGGSYIRRGGPAKATA